MPVLNLLADGVVAKSYSLNKPVTRIGRLPACDISIDDPSSSGLHAQIEINNGNQAEGIIEVFIEDMNSTNGTYVNGHKVTRCRLYNTDVIEIGCAQFKIDISVNDSLATTLDITNSSLEDHD